VFENAVVAKIFAATPQMPSAYAEYIASLKRWSLLNERPESASGIFHVAVGSDGPPRAAEIAAGGSKTGALGPPDCSLHAARAMSMSGTVLVLRRFIDISE
jgi:hypothetical protein